MKKLLVRLFSRKPTVVVQTYKVRKTDHEKRRRAVTDPPASAGGFSLALR